MIVSRKHAFLLLVIMPVLVLPSIGAEKLLPPDTKWVEETLKGMSLKDKVGQMIITWYQPIVSEQLVKEFGVGGFFVSGIDALSLARATNALQEVSRIPLLFAADYESGIGDSTPGGTDFPSNMALGATGDPDLAYQCGKITAMEARAVGVHYDFSPVVDVNVEPANPIISTRSYGDDPKLVSRMACAYIKGLQEHGVLATAKHFPGHGATRADSHRIMPVVLRERNEIEQVDLVPYVAAIKEADVASVMTAHLWMPALDPQPGPATVSPKVMTGLLRDHLGFKGLLVSDSYGMRGITDHFSDEDAAVLGVKAGLDIVLTPRVVEKAVNAILGAVDRGEISTERIDRSVRRILTAKTRLALHKQAVVDVSQVATLVGTPEHHVLAKEIARRAITLVKKGQTSLPLSSERTYLVVNLSTRRTGWFSRVHEYFGDALDAFHKGVKVETLTTDTDEEERRKILSAAKDADEVLVANFSWVQIEDDTVLKFARDLLTLKKPLTLISFGSPYVVLQLPEVDTFLCTYDRSLESQIAAAEVLCGKRTATGKLPVGFPGLFDRGTGIGN
jgi:beta-N-acetylhexosaminidase